MLKKHSKFFETLVLFSDWLVLSCSWILAYSLRFNIQVVPVYKGIPPFITYLTLLIIIIPLWGIVFKTFDLYRPRRISTKIAEIMDISKATTIATLFLISSTFFIRQYEFSRLMFLFFWIISIVALCVSRILFREFFRYIREKGYNLRYALIVGTGNLAGEITDKLHKHPELGIKIRGFLRENSSDVSDTLKGYPIIDSFENIRNVIIKNEIDIVLIALPLRAHAELKSLLDNIADEMVTIMIIPDLFEFITLRSGVDEFEGMPVISLRDSPLYGWNIIAKRGTDIFLSAFIILLTSPLMIVITLVTKLTSNGSIFYRQERMGLDGNIFTMLKFRTMKINAEEETGPVWAARDDNRRTVIGTFLRKTSLDEIPQFFNVLKGEMSIVGPRPERPYFIRQFRDKIPKYMLRHKMKAG
ncbi:MAG: exopolysaccharide biosynthesis polyprenyl glycosylphosphotransferase, partial [Planctomycetes bacterium]|nr:exopolysaccharide biosynthesis polyprenyl glycosylphosphotransferase [Planctomycetota bacterium]